MRIVFTSPYSPRSVSGIGMFLRELSRALHERSHTCRIIAPRHHSARPGSPGTEEVTIAEVAADRLSPFQNLALGVGTARQLLRTRGEVDVVHAQQAHVQTAVAILVARIMGCRIVSTLHARVPRPRGWVRSTLLSLAEWFTVRFSDDIAYVSHGTRTDFGGSFGRVIPNGIDTSRFSSDPRERERHRRELSLGSSCVVLFLGRWARLKGVREAVESAAIVIATRGDAVRFALVGGGSPEERTAVTADLRARGVESAVVTDWDPKDVWTWYNTADVFILPSHLEGMPLALLEAMSMGLACIVTPVGGIPEVVEDGVDALVVRPGDGEALAQAILRCADDSELRRAIGRRAREKARALFDLDRMADDYIKLYSRLPRP